MPFLRLLPWLLALAVLGGCAESSEDATARPDGSGIRVVEVIDGDTFDITLPDGSTERVRIIGVNAPERGECRAEAATRWLAERIDGEAVTLVEDRSDRDRYGRLLRYVELDGTDVGRAMVADGLAIARRYPPDTARADRLESAQEEAQARGLGLWASDACGAAADGADVLAITEVRFDADGPDGENLNDEWVRITNRGGEAVELTGWRLRDESAGNRYEFPDGFVLVPAATVTVRSGCGTDSASELHWCASRSAIWNNDGDTAFLLDPAGNVVAQHAG